MFRSIATLTLCLMTITAEAALLSRAVGQAYYDTDTDLTWIADANLAQTSGYDGDGQMTWVAAVGWIASLNAQNAGLGYLGVNNWRLPTVTDTGLSGCDWAFTGTDCGYNVDLATGEMAGMFYASLGNTGRFNTSGSMTGCGDTPPNYCLTNSGPFSNLQTYNYYWSGPEYAPSASSDAWLFGFSNGFQINGNKGIGYYAWAVRTGDIAPVPVPAAVWLFGSALGLMGVMRRKISS